MTDRLLALLFTIIFTTTVCYAQLNTHATDVSLYEAIINNNPTSWGQLSRWAIGTDPCTGGQEIAFGVAGITCEEIDGAYRITEITLPGIGMPFKTRSLSGEIPTQIGQFPYLRSLNLEWNNLTGPLPDFVSTSMFNIDLAFNNLTGSIPASYFNQPSLLSLNLGRNKLTGSLPSTMKGAPFRVQLFSNQLSGSVSLRFNMSNLIYYNLNNNNFSGRLPADFVEGAHMLNQLYLQQNSFSGRLPSSIEALPALTHLDVSKNKFTDEIPNFESTSLVSVIMAKNNFKGPIPLAFQHSQSLSLLVLSCNQLSDTIPNYLGDLPNLQVLRLEVNFLSGDLPSFLQSTPLVGGGDSISGFVNQRINFNATCNDFYGPLPTWCGPDGSRTCVTCSDEQRSCADTVFISNPRPLSPSASPEPEEVDSAAQTVHSSALVAAARLLTQWWF